MNKNIFYLFVFFILLVFVSTGCLSQPTQEAFRETDTQLPNTPTPLPPSATHSPPTSTVTVAATPTDIPTVTFTPEPPMLIVKQDTKCRIGPGLVYDVQAYFTSGTTASLSGYIDGDPTWWLAEFGEDSTETQITCWVSDQIISVSGDLELLPLLTPPPTPTPSPVPTLVGAVTYYYLIAEDTGGPIGCGDSLIPIYPGTIKTGDLEADVRAVLNALFSNPHKYYNGLYNALYESSLRAIDVEEGAGYADIYLGGNFVRPKDDCESKRMRAQVWYTIMQFPETGRPIVWLNNALLGDLLVVIKK